MGWQWDDIRFFLAVCRAGSLSGAARDLDVDHATVGRRLAAFERKLGAKLVNRTPEGFSITSAGQQIFADCESMEGAALAVERRAAGQDARSAGRVSVATTENLACQLVVPAVAELRTTHPQLEVNVLADFRLLDITRRQADIAVRLPRPAESRLVCRKLGAYGFTLYASGDYLAKRGTPKRGRGLGGHWLVTYLDPMSGPGPPFMGESFDGSLVVFRSNSTFAQMVAVTNGLGISELPCCLGDSQPRLQRVWPDEPPTPYPVWLITHEDLRRAARIRLVSNAIVKQFEQRRGILRYGLGSRGQRLKARPTAPRFEASDPGTS